MISRMTPARRAGNRRVKIPEAPFDEISLKIAIEGFAARPGGRPAPLASVARQPCNAEGSNPSGSVAPSRRDVASRYD